MQVHLTQSLNAELWYQVSTPLNDHSFKGVCHKITVGVRHLTSCFILNRWHLLNCFLNSNLCFYVLVCLHSP